MAMELVGSLPYDHPYRWDGTLFGSPKLWRPNELAGNLGLWLDAEDSASITLNGTTVSQWNDKSGNGRNAAQATATNQPTYTAAGLSGKPVVTFDGTNDSMPVDLSFLAGTSYSVSAIIARSSTKLNNWFIGGATAVANRQLILGWPTDTTFNYAQYSNDVSTTVAGYTTTTPLIVSVGLNTAVGRSVFLDGTAGNSSTTKTALTTNSGGVLGTWSGASFYQGYIAELVVSTGALSSANREKIEGYLAWKWGVEASLPIGHPYKNSPPTV